MFPGHSQLLQSGQELKAALLAVPCRSPPTVELTAEEVEQEPWRMLIVGSLKVHAYLAFLGSPGPPPTQEMCGPQWARSSYIN